MESKDIGFGKAEFVAKTQFLYVLFIGLILKILQKFTALKMTIFQVTLHAKKSMSDSQQFHTNVEDIVAFYV